MVSVVTRLIETPIETLVDSTCFCTHPRPARTRQRDAHGKLVGRASLKMGWFFFHALGCTGAKATSGQLTEWGLPFMRRTYAQTMRGRRLLAVGRAEVERNASQRQKSHVVMTREPWPCLCLRDWPSTTELECHTPTNRLTSISWWGVIRGADLSSPFSALGVWRAERSSSPSLLPVPVMPGKAIGPSPLRRRHQEKPPRKWAS
ncbi:hypothetical protein B0T14DRAFT_212418 [Immersiella caudata]|uniref:Uncharacterized protein n=1 Tax=Immersiella caudata TaxID=314043 RepID=A0AA39WQJ2_9PEZI|nr:hypothetical protein B0T14DRAFT_212418 [Immersiella caudata]